jgi:aspartate kinase
MIKINRIMNKSYFYRKLPDMKIYKFGGASVRDAGGIENMAGIVSAEKDGLVIVVSAFGKTTDALERVLNAWMRNDDSYRKHFDNVYNEHISIAKALFPGGDPAIKRIHNSFAKLGEYLSQEERSVYDYEYDQIVSYGEIWSTMLIAEYLNRKGLNVKWVDIRNKLVTDDRYREANILWGESYLRIRPAFDLPGYSCYLTQGFIGATIAGQTTTLGREGSDYTAAVLATILDAESVTFWKDVPGLLNADPRWMPDVEKLEEISYREAVEMTFSGAKVIHPKTIKPLHNRNIPLYVKSFIDPQESGTLVTEEPRLRIAIPVFIRKENQVLLSLLPKDFSFVMGDNLSSMFQTFIRHGIKVNLIDASAVSINVCIDDERDKIDSLLDDLKHEYSAVYNDNVELLSVRHYTAEALEKIMSGREILLEQKSRSMARLVTRQPVTASG